MVKKQVTFILCGLFLAITFATAESGEITPQRVIDHVKKAVDLIVAEGSEKAFPLLSDPNGAFVDGDLYVFTYDMDGTIIQHLRPKLVGKNMMNIKDKKGKCLACDFVRIAKEEGEGWSQYWWPRPSTGELALKVSYIMKVPGLEMFVGVGVYDMPIEEVEKAANK